MRVSFFSNYLNEHQLPLCLALSALKDVDFTFIALAELGGNAGRNNLNDDYSFVLKEYAGKSASDAAMRHATEDEVVVFGHMGGKEQYVQSRMDKNLLSFRATERLLKRGLLWRFMPPKVLRTHQWFTQYKKLNMHVLCTSAYASYDLSLSGWPQERCYKWGYFPNVAESNAPTHERGDTASIVWAARHIQLKRPFEPLQLSKELKDAGYRFHLTMAGDGPLRQDLERYVSVHGLSDVVSFCGMLTGSDAKALYAQSDICLVTSTREEGWGAVVNEAMAAGCAVVASASMGSAPFLISDGETGLLYDDLDTTGVNLLAKVERLLNDPCLLEAISNDAARVMKETWSAEVAASRLIRLADALEYGGEADLPYDSGPCSPAFVLEDGWYHKP